MPRKFLHLYQSIHSSRNSPGIYTLTHTNPYLPPSISVISTNTSGDTDPFPLVSSPPSPPPPPFTCYTSITPFPPICSLAIVGGIILWRLGVQWWHAPGSGHVYRVYLSNKTMRYLSNLYKHQDNYSNNWSGQSSSILNLQMKQKKKKERKKKDKKEEEIHTLITCSVYLLFFLFVIFIS